MIRFLIKYMVDNFGLKKCYIVILCMVTSIQSIYQFTSIGYDYNLS